MKTRSSISVKILALSVIAGSATAADLATTKGPPPVPTLAPLWSGVYAGVNIGGGWNNSTGNFGNYFNADGFNAGVSNRLPSGGIGGGQIGYNYQLSRLIVTGAEADFQGTTMGSGSSISNAAFYTNRWNYSLGTSLNWYGTVRGRAGLTLIPSVLLYGTGGLAYGYVSRNGIVPNGSVQTGWTAGGGVEWMFLQNWSAKAEYLYTNMSGGPTTLWGFYPSLKNALPISVNNQTGWNTVRAGVNYHFALGATTSITGASIQTPQYDATSFALPSFKAPDLQAPTAQLAQVDPKIAQVSKTASAAPAQPSSSTVSSSVLSPATGTLPDISLSDIIHP